MKKEWIALMKGSGITLMIPFFFLFSMNFTVLTAQVGVNKNVTLKASQQRLEQVLEKLAKQTFLHFYCNEAIKDTKVSASVENASLAETMRALLQNTGLQYSIQDGNVIIVRIPAKNKKLSLLKGYITDMNKKPIPGATLFVKTAGVGAATDITGTFTFSAPIPYGSLITVSFIGMKTRNIVYGGEESIRIFLEEDVHELESVIVTGFQTISRERSTGAANIIKKDYLEKIQSPNLGSKLEGITPGLTSYNGNMSIRGISSFAVNSTPLLVLDGQPITGVSINDLNPDDIESITLLKDAAATSLYGVRASNGVIVVTTKRGTTQKATISLSAGFYIDPLPSLSYQHYASTSDIIDYEQQYLLNNPTYLENPLQYFESMNRMESPQPFTQIDRLYYNLAQGKISQEQLNTQIQALRSKDYRKEYRNALQQMKFTQNYNMNISQSGDYSNLFFSARFEDMGSHNKQYNADKFSFYLKNELNLTKWFKFTYGTNVSILNSQAEDYNSEAKANQYATRPMPYESLYHEDGSLSYWYPTNYDLSQKLAATEGLNGLQYNAIEESNKNLIDTDDLYWKLFAHTDMQLLKGLDLGLK
ncbi:MAG: TonB-dependent receptor plug domain-containing protein, partial [Bacteroidales bacterium]